VMCLFAVMIIFLFANILSQRYEMNFNFKYFYTMGFLEMSLINIAIHFNI